MAKEAGASLLQPEEMQRPTLRFLRSSSLAGSSVTATTGAFPEDTSIVLS